MADETLDHLIRPDSNVDGEHLIAEDDYNPTAQADHLVRPDSLNDDDLIASDNFTYPLVVIQSDLVQQYNLLTQPTLTQHSRISLFNVEQTVSLSTASHVQHYALQTEGVEQITWLNEHGLTQHGSIVLADLYQDGTLEEGLDLIQSHRVAVDTVSQTVSSDTAYLEQTGTLTALEFFQFQQTSALNLTQHYFLQVNNLQQVGVFGQTNFSVSYDLVVQSPLQETWIAGNITLTPFLKPNVIAQWQEVGESVPDISGYLFLRGVEQEQRATQFRFTGVTVSYLIGEVVIYTAVDAEPYMGPLVIGETYITS